MKKIVSLIVLVVFVASCSNDENEEILNNEIKKIEAKAAASKSDYLAKDGEVVSSSTGTDTLAPPPPIYSDPKGFCEECDIDPPKGGTKP
ncbi:MULTISPECIES: membrane lipoprotein lipid attachment site-containing protein [Flavobacterium]|uniref:Type IV secretion system putative lipoprotein virB7 n=1 Tax=Flavobacterium hankyongi TaxID=1176532 RepID=A0ABP8ZME9_9FLAO|nr:membrane lipoprotein lipid attachment site-containing protein [Flavobacterium sp. N1846]